MDDDERPQHADFFSGICGFALAAGWAGFQTTTFCEIEPFCQRLIAKRFLADPHGERQPQLQRGESQGAGRVGDSGETERRVAPYAAIWEDHFRKTLELDAATKRGESFHPAVRARCYDDIRRVDGWM